MKIEIYYVKLFQKLRMFLKTSDFILPLIFLNLRFQKSLLLQKCHTKNVTRRQTERQTDKQTDTRKTGPIELLTAVNKYLKGINFCGD